TRLFLRKMEENYTFFNEECEELIEEIISSTSSKRKFIGCTNWKMGELDHRYMIIPDNIDLEFLKTMFNEYSYHANGIDFERDESNVIDECFM
ncbi:17058_t:CDS:2, partial [Dentiscutata erythropus]